MYENKYTQQGLMEARERVIEKLGEKRFYKLSNQKQEEEVAICYFADLITRVALDQIEKTRSDLPGNL